MEIPWILGLKYLKHSRNMSFFQFFLKNNLKSQVIFPSLFIWWQLFLCGILSVVERQWTLKSGKCSQPNRHCGRELWACKIATPFHGWERDISVNYTKRPRKQGSNPQPWLSDWCLTHKGDVFTNEEFRIITGCFLSMCYLFQGFSFFFNFLHKTHFY